MGCRGGFVAGLSSDRLVLNEDSESQPSKIYREKWQWVLIRESTLDRLNDGTAAENVAVEFYRAGSKPVMDLLHLGKTLAIHVGKKL